MADQVEREDELKKVLDFAAGCGIAGHTFLAMWRNGDWEGMGREFPTFDRNILGDFRKIRSG